MQTNWTERTELLIKKEGLQKLQNSNILIVGLGGVGGYAAEQLCRAGIGKMTIIDSDIISPTNRNRQIIALKSTENEQKATVMAQRLRDINSEIKLKVINKFIEEAQMLEVLSLDYDYVVDAIDTLKPKIFLIYHSLQKGLKVVSSMGAGGKLDPTQIHISDISKSYKCHLARMLRKKLHKLNIYKGIKVVFSSEQVIKSSEKRVDEKNKMTTLGTISYLPAIFGSFCASVVIRDLISL